MTLSTQQACSSLAEVYKAHPEWPDALFEAISAEGELRPGTPENVLPALGLTPKSFHFEGDDFVAVWKWKESTVTTRNGRVHADK
jgi:hypothetical protein